MVVGNNSYHHASTLNSPVADAVDIGEILKGGGFTILKLTDATRGQMVTGLQELNQQGANADVCFVYFSGHGIEVEGKNYLVPVDGQLRDHVDLTSQLIPLSSVLEVLRRTNSKRKIVVLDCCRSDPFKTVSGGLAAIAETQFPPGTLIVYAGAPGKPVPDGRGRNSPFTAELIRHMQPGRDVLSLFASVAAARFQAQDPWIKFDGSGESFADLRVYDLLAGAPPRRANADIPEDRSLRLKISSYWNHNGSTMGLLVDGQQRIMIYIKVREGLNGLVEPGTVLFYGQSREGKYSGKARRFTAGLPPIEYPVNGPILGGGNSVVLTGRAPIRNPDGSIKKVIEDRLEFTFIKLPN